MNDYTKLIIFNIIIISLSFLFKKNIVLFYVFLLIFLLMFILTYMMILKNKLIEGNFQEELFESLDYVDSNKQISRLPLDKISLILETMLEKLSGTKIENQNKCKGEFIINNLTNKSCGDGFNERVYKILDPGDGDCLHSELYKEKIPLKFCGYGEKCEKDLDCKSNRCNDGLCDFELDCSETMLSGCKYDSCLALNNDLDKDLYFWSDNKCNANPCNKNDFKMCDEGGCNDLSYRFKYDKETKQCNEIINGSGESTTEPESMEETYQRYTEAGGHDEICVDLDVKSCSVGADLQPRYYCKDGYWNGEGETRGTHNECEECPPGFAGTEGNCKQCPVKSVSNANRTKCVACEPGLISLRGKCSTCSDGTEYNDDMNACVACPPGFAGTEGICSACSDGKHPTVDMSACEDCPPGQIWAEGICSTCSDGTEYNSDKRACEACHSGFAGTEGNCKQCPVKFVSNDNRTKCVACAPGLISLGGKCSTCSDGTEYNDDMNACVACPPGQTGSKGICSACSDGKQPNESMNACVDCPPGFAGTKGICSACSDGKQPNESMSACVDCLSGFAGTEGNCKQCSVKSVSNANRTKCVACAPGLISLGGKCSTCSDGTEYNSGTGACEACQGAYVGTGGLCNIQCLASTGNELRGMQANASRTECLDICEVPVRPPCSLSGDTPGTCPHGSYPAAVDIGSIIGAIAEFSGGGENGSKKPQWVRDLICISNRDPEQKSTADDTLITLSWDRQVLCIIGKGEYGPDVKFSETNINDSTRLTTPKCT